MASLKNSQAVPAMADLKAFRVKLLACVDRETALGDTAAQRSQYTELGRITPMWGQCVPVAMAVKGAFGGKLVRYELKVRLNGEVTKQVHWANHFDGQEIDLTSDQYNGDGIHAVDDSQHGVVGKPPKGPVPVEVLEVISKKVQSDFYYGRIGHRTHLLAERLKNHAAFT